MKQSGESGISSENGMKFLRVSLGLTTVMFSGGITKDGLSESSGIYGLRSKAN